MKFLRKPNIKWLVLAFLAIALLYVYSLSTTVENLPVYNPADVNPRLVDKSIQNVKENHKISDFKLINQNGDTITQADYKNKIYVTDFFFTRCPSICPIMTNNMAILQDTFKNDDAIMFLSLSVTPIIDSVSVLKNYADRHGVIASKWNVTTGDKKHIYELARKSYFAVVSEGDGGLQDFIHTEKFVLVDKEQQIRGFYDGTNNEEIQRLINDINILTN